MLTILLVEDDAVLRGGLTELFTREGYSVVAASCVKEAREKLSGNVNLIVLDVGLPDGANSGAVQAWLRRSFSSQPKMRNLMLYEDWMLAVMTMLPNRSA